MTTELTIPDVVRVLDRIGACQASVSYVNSRLTVQGALDDVKEGWLTWLIETLIEEKLLSRGLIEKKLKEIAHQALTDFPEEFDTFSIEALSAYDAEDTTTEISLRYLELTENEWKAAPETSRRESRAYLVYSLYNHAHKDDRICGYNLFWSFLGFLHLRDYGTYGDLDKPARDAIREEMSKAARKKMCKAVTPWLYEAFGRALERINEEEREAREEETDDESQE